MDVTKESTTVERYDVIVVGGGNAALAAALSAHEHDAKVLVLEAAFKEERGGNSRFAGNVYRVPHTGLEQIKTKLCEATLPDSELVNIEPYTREDYNRDFSRVSQGRNDPSITKVVIDNAFEAVQWMRKKGVEWDLALRKSYSVDSLKPGEKANMEPGGVLMARGGGVGLMQNLWAAVEKTSICVKYDCPAHDLIISGDTVLSVRTRQRSQYLDIYGKVILASGGFSADPALRRQYLGEGWDLVLVRGTKFNTGTMLRRAIDVGASTIGHWGAYHASPQDFDGPRVSDINVSPIMPRYAYLHGITVNVNGARFFNEGEDFFSKTYAKTGKKIADQPEAKAFQIFDQRTISLLPKRYKTATPFQGDTPAALAAAIGVNASALEKSIAEFNAACSTGKEKTFSRYELDGLLTDPGLPIPKSNWAIPLDHGPLVANAVRCGVAFTYGGIATDVQARVLNKEGRHMPGLWAIGEIAGGLFYHNYPGGAGLTEGTVSRRIAGKNAANAAAATTSSSDGTVGPTKVAPGKVWTTNGIKSAVKMLNEEP